LEMTRLDSGRRLIRAWYPLEEIVGAALTRLERSLRGRTVATDIPIDLPLVWVDEVLLEQVFINLLENALKYTPERTPIGIAAGAQCNMSENTITLHEVLIIEDDPEIRRFLRTALGAEQYRLREATTAAEGLRQATISPDVIVLDLGLPDMDGIDLIRQVRKKD